MRRSAGRCATTEPFPALDPPEGVGGFPGYYEFLDAMADPKHPEHDHLKDWYGDAFNPNQPETDELKLEVLSVNPGDKIPTETVE